MSIEVKLHKSKIKLYVCNNNKIIFLYKFYKMKANEIKLVWLVDN